MRTLHRIRRITRVVTLGLVVAAVATELAKPAPERTWHGRVFGAVPYDFRPPTWRKIREAFCVTSIEGADSRSHRAALCP